MTDDKNKKYDSEVTNPDGLPEEHPTRIGAYKILDILGEGGMAVVYLAEQSEPVKRRVALKILKPGMDTKQIVARFESERQSLAVLDHPNIAKIFDGGITEFGRPYFVMERVRGVPITDYCDDHRLNTEDRVRLFIGVCSAVQHAHHKGLIHRDLKPSNLLVGVVDGKPQVKVIDFGIAKAATPTMTEKTLVTLVGQIIGTPQYMSPEQADASELDVDTRTDIYSLGVVLYELLVGTVPLDLAHIGDHAISLALRERDPVKPSTRITELGDTLDEVAKARRTDGSTLKRLLQGDLDWVVMQAIEKDRTNRYATANALAMECRRYLQHQPVLARPHSTGYLLRRFIRRNRLMVTAGSVAIVAVIVGAAAATLGLVRATDAEKNAVHEAETARATTQFLVDLFQVSDPWSVAPVSTKSGAEITAREVLDRGADRIRIELSGQPEIQSSLMNAIGQVYTGLGAVERAEELLLEGMRTRQAVFPPRHTSIGDSLQSLGFLYYTTGKYADAAEAQREAASIYQEAWGEDSLGAAKSLNQLAITLANKGDLQEALEVQFQALDIFRSHPDSKPLDLALGLNNLGHVQNLLDTQSAALESFEEAVSILADTTARGHHASALANLAAIYQVTGQIAKSEPLHEQALAIKKEWFGPGHIEVAFSENNLSWVYRILGDYEKAEVLIRDAIRIFSTQLGDDHPNVGIVSGNLAHALRDQGMYTEAEATYRNALRLVQNALGEKHMNVVHIYNGLAALYALQDRHEEAEKLYRRTLEVTAANNATHSEAGVARAEIANLPASSLTTAEREQYYEDGLDILANTEGLGTPRAALIQIDFAVFLAGQGKEARAKEWFDGGLQNLSAALPADNPRYLEQVTLYEDLFGKPATRLTH